MSVQVASLATAGEKTMATTAWPYLEYMAQWERQVERRQLFLRSYHFSRDAEVSPRARTRRVVWAGARRLRRAAAKGLRRLRARIRLCFCWAAPALRRRSSPRCGGVHGFRYGRLPERRRRPRTPRPSASGSLVAVYIRLWDAVNITDSLAFLFLWRRSRARSHSTQLVQYTG